MKSRIIIPLDGMTRDEALSLAKALSGHVWGFKVNDLLIKCGTEIIKDLKQFGNVMADPKLYDIPNTVANSIANLSLAGSDMITIHCSGGKEMIGAAVQNAGDSKILGVTVLTSFNDLFCKEIYKTKVNTTFQRLASVGLGAGIHGLVSSGHELRAVSNICELYEDCYDVIRVIPGIRPFWYQENDDQARKMTPAKAVKAGATYIVIGRPIYRDNDPVAAADRTNNEIWVALQ